MVLSFLLRSSAEVDVNAAFHSGISTWQRIGPVGCNGPQQARRCVRQDAAQWHATSHRAGWALESNAARTEETLGHGGVLGRFTASADKQNDPVLQNRARIRFDNITTHDGEGKRQDTEARQETPKRQPPPLNIIRISATERYIHDHITLTSAAQPICPIPNVYRPEH
jgi:hypothetical protein